MKLGVNESNTPSGSRLAYQIFEFDSKLIDSTSSNCNGS